MADHPVPPSLSRHVQKLLYAIKLSRDIMSYDPAKQGLVVHHWHVVITTVTNYNCLLTLRRFHRPVKPDGKRVPPDELRLYRETHQYLGPGCLCPLLEPLTEYKEAAIYLTVDGLYKGEYVAECADDRCEYLSQSPFS